jgi:hypothetical protein
MKETFDEIAKALTLEKTEALINAFGGGAIYPQGGLYPPGGAQPEDKKGVQRLKP